MDEFCTCTRRLDKSLNPHGRKVTYIYLKEGKKNTLILPTPPPPSFILLSYTLGIINVAKFAQGGGGQNCSWAHWGTLFLSDGHRNS